MSMTFADHATAVEVTTRVARRTQTRFRIRRDDDGRWNAVEVARILTAREAVQIGRALEFLDAVEGNKRSDTPHAPRVADSSAEQPAEAPESHPSISMPADRRTALHTQPCGRGICAAEDGHEGTCAEASGWGEW